MIHPRVEQRYHHVAEHYDDLNQWYLEIWGEHVHHGLWETGAENPELATLQLTHKLIEALDIQAGNAVVDIGCGYGGTARILANGVGAKVTAFTLSKAQYDYAVEKACGQTNPEFRLRNWFDNGLPGGSQDAAISIESSEHMEDKPAFFKEVVRVLKPGGRFGVYAWLARPDPSRCEIACLLEPICREGRLPGMGNEAEYREMMLEAGLVDITYEDLSQKVKKTWPVIVGRMAKRLPTDPEARRFLRSGPNREFARTVFRIWLAYNTGSMRYGLFTCRKP
ncbi:MAG: class I SAM-dependent methyltransferase [Candidatus Hydrogenedentes bacterium]|nr:class I SAM-dependent methyltransferase [Candidatus Hydrogenedentota bacterium]